MNQKGFTIPEFLVGALIMTTVIALTYPAFIDLLSDSKSQATSDEARMDRIVNLELLRLDLEHVGFGIARDEANLPIEWDTANDILTLRSTMNNTNMDTLGWLMFDCTSGGALSSNDEIDNRSDTSNNDIILLDSDKNYAATTTVNAGNCPAPLDVYTGYSYDASGTNGCGTQFCTTVQYRLSNANVPTECAAGTQNLLRVVGAGAGTPIMHCVADFKVTFERDTTGDGAVDTNLSTALPVTTSAIQNQVKNIDVYILAQQGREDRNINSNEDLTIDIGLSNAGVTNPSNYRWKVIRVNGKPMSW